MHQIKLIKPTMAYANDIMDYRQEFLDLGDSLDGCGSLRACSTAEEWIRDLVMLESLDTCPKDKVCSDTYLAIRLSDDSIVGIIDFRHHINHPILGVWGGHIGYSVRPKERRKGYATEMLKQILVKCRLHGLEKVLVTCNNDNVASKKTIIANGGIYENTVLVEGDKKERYWINL
ncbi:MAG: GNAT family N-acetyltransferase [Dethiosulfatibacter sp.]|nr:GNAT family N-acetyltransferase [Dethiosulfatibacter sp.]